MKNILESNGNEELRFINPSYKDIAEMFNALSELYKNANDKTLIDEMVKIINNPLLFMKK
jgi:hypothetical protein